MSQDAAPALADPVCRITSCFHARSTALDAIAGIFLHGRDAIVTGGGRIPLGARNIARVVGGRIKPGRHSLLATRKLSRAVRASGLGLRKR